MSYINVFQEKPDKINRTCFLKTQFSSIKINWKHKIEMDFVFNAEKSDINSAILIDFCLIFTAKLLYGILKQVVYCSEI
jgi:hypothetical protein